MVRGSKACVSFSVAATALWVLATIQVAQAEPLNALVSPMIDQSIFQKGQIERFRRTVKGWSAVCDEVKALNRRFCSLRSSVVADSGGRPIFVDVSTGDHGEPAALLHLPSGISLGPGVSIAVEDARSNQKSRRPGARSGATTEAKVAICSGQECLAAWSLQPGEVTALLRGGDIALSYCSIRAAPSEFRLSLASTNCERRFSALVSGSGFKDVVTASIR